MCEHVTAPRRRHKFEKIIVFARFECDMTYFSKIALVYWNYMCRKTQLGLVKNVVPIGRERETAEITWREKKNKRVILPFLKVAFSTNGKDVVRFMENIMFQPTKKHITLHYSVFVWCFGGFRLTPMISERKSTKLAHFTSLERIEQ